VTPKQLVVTAEIIGFLATIALTLQTVRLLRHQRSVRDLRGVAEDLKKLKDQPEESGKDSRKKAIELAEKGAKLLEESISQWDKRDQYFVFIGLVGLMLSFVVKILSFCLEK
jgi:hypothetical protein